ncbi:hypothetical protein KSP39_PZI002135 [Platanthera zijinensis]|uniref:SCP domain-containing protein n=1 Tax=Platanthera zijinensis TaxID=2320716 RepID=A0AAP0BZ40_9ASPA
MTHLISIFILLLFFTATAAFSADTGRHAYTPNASAVLADEFLVPQNAVRLAVGLRPLAWDPRLASYAQRYAMQRLGDCKLIHSGGPYGENIFWGSGSGWNPAQAVASWAGEKRWYSSANNSCTAGRICGHYTQIVWRATLRVGCASVNCEGDRGQFIVCEYDPPGNYIGERPY